MRGSRCRRPLPRSVRDRSPRVGPPEATCSSMVLGPRVRSGCAGGAGGASVTTPSLGFFRPRPPRRRLFFGALVSAPSSPEDAADGAAGAWSGWASSRWLSGVCCAAPAGAPLRRPSPARPRPPRRRGTASAPSSLRSEEPIGADRSVSSTAVSARADPDPPPRPRPLRPRPPRLRRRVGGGSADPPSSPWAPSSLSRSGPSGPGVFCLAGAFSRTGALLLGALPSGVRSRGSSGVRSGALVAGSPDG